MFIVSHAWIFLLQGHQKCVLSDLRAPGQMPAPVQTVWLGGLTGPRLMQVCHLAALGLWVLSSWTPSRDPNTVSVGAGSMDSV